MPVSHGIHDIVLDEQVPCIKAFARPFAMPFLNITTCHYRQNQLNVPVNLIPCQLYSKFAFKSWSCHYYIPAIFSPTVTLIHNPKYGHLSKQGGNWMLQEYQTCLLMLPHIDFSFFLTANYITQPHMLYVSTINCTAILLI